MNKVFYPKLALNNIRKNYQTQIPFMITCVSVIMMFYIIYSLSINEGLAGLEKGSGTTIALLGYGNKIIGIFAIIFLLYTNGFLIKRRKKEFGLYAILGMEKKHIARILVYETLIIFVTSLVLGLVLGVVFDKVMFMFLLNILGVAIPLGFYISFESMLVSSVLFGVIFLVLLLRSISQVYINQPIELLKGGSVGEKEPKIKWVLAILGAVCLAIGYYIALTTTNPLSAVMMFFVAVVLVIVGTYLLFTAGSIAFLKMQRKRRNHYYKANNFISISSMLYRMKQNALGLASICILSTMVLIMLSTTTSLLIGLEDTLKLRSPYDVEFEFYASETDTSVFELMKNDVTKVLEENNIATKDVVEYDFLKFLGATNGTKLIVDESTLEGLATMDNIYLVVLIPVTDYNRLANEEVNLAANEVLIDVQGAGYKQNTISIFDTEYKIAGMAKDFAKSGNDSAMIFPKMYLIVKDENVMFDIFDKRNMTNNMALMDISHYYAFNLVDTSREPEMVDIIRSTAFYRGQVDYAHSGYSYSTKYATRNDVYDMYGGLFFLGFFLAIIFIIGTTLIIYYKQITEGYEDKERFEILQQVGMSHEEVRKSISSQVLQVFFLPLVVAIIHLLAAYKIVSSFMALLSFNNNNAVLVWSTVLTISLFAIFYIAVYVITAQVYYKIIKR